MARTKMKIVGLGNRMQGVSKKNGKPYDFQPISFVYKDQYTNGYKAATSNVPGDMIAGRSFRITWHCAGSYGQHRSRPAGGQPYH